MGVCGLVGVGGGGGGGVRVPLRRDGRFANRPYGGAFVALRRCCHLRERGEAGGVIRRGAGLDVLVEEDGVAVGVFGYEAVGAVGGLVGFTD